MYILARIVHGSILFFKNIVSLKGGIEMRGKIFFLMQFVGVVILLVTIVVTGVNADYKYDYYDYNEMAVLLEDLESQSSLQTPDVYSLHIIGYSYQDNPIYAVKFSDDPEIEEDDEPDIVIDSGIHSKEWNPVATTIKYIEYLFTAYYDDLHPDHSEVVDLVHNFEIWFIPMINPDGRIRDDLNNGDPCSFWTDTTYHDHDYTGWRMNVQEVDCPAKPGGVNIGIDLNRSFSVGFKWDLTGNYTCEGTWYPGPVPIAAPESRVLKQFINNHMVSFVLHQHSSGQLIFTSSETAVNISDEIVTMYSDESADPRLLPEINFQTSFSGQYHHWLFNEVDDDGAPDDHSQRAIQCFNYEVGPLPADYGVGEDGKICQYERDDGSNVYRISSGEWMEWFIDMNVKIYTYIIKQSKYPFSPRYYSDMSLRPEAPTTDLAIVGAKISEVGTGLPGCFTYDEDDGRDMLEPGIKTITWNVQNNGTSIRTINSEISICNLTDDPDCLSPTTAILTRVDVPAEGIETFTYDYDFQAGKDCSVTLTTGESNEYDNDLKRYIFTTLSPQTCPTELIYERHSEKMELLRHFRDKVLSKTPEGQEIIRLYYEWSPVIVKAMEEDEKFKEEVKKMIDGVLPLIRGGIK